MAGVEVKGLKEFKAELRAMHPQWPKALTEVHHQIATRGARDSKSAARGMGGVQRKGATAIGQRSTQNTASVAVLPSRLDAFGAVAYWGAKKRTGWYAPMRYSQSTRQHPVWVGNSWEACVAGQGPYAINNALARHLNEYLKLYLEMVDDLAAKAFPEGKN